MALRAAQHLVRGGLEACRAPGSAFVPVRTYLASTLSVHDMGSVGSVEHQRYFADSDGNTISPWHMIPLAVEDGKGLFNFVAEIPRGHLAKYEISTDTPYNPIMLDTRNGEPRMYPFGSAVNYGALPQTFEDPDHVDPRTGFKGDGDPIDVVEIGSARAEMGEVYPVKVVGILGMIDEGEMDWKVIAIRASDPLASEFDDIADAPESVTNMVDLVVEWFRTYKVADGKPENEFAFGGKAAGRDVALEVIAETHAQWKSLLGTSVPDPSPYEIIDTPKQDVWFPPAPQE